MDLKSYQGRLMKTTIQCTVIKHSLITAVSSLCLLFTVPAHADFRKALEAYQNRDGATMLKEVNDAVEKKNDNGLILFLSMLELDKTLSNSRMFVFPNEREADAKLQVLIKQGKELPTPWQTILSISQVDDFKILLEKATMQSSLESQYRLASLQSINGYQVSYSPSQSDMQAALLGSLKALGSKGYLNVFPYLADMENQKHVPVKVSSYKKGVELGQTKLAMLQAADYLVGNKDRNITRNEKKGLQLLEQALSKPDAEFYYADVANRVSNYYINKGTKQEHQQAYFWSLVALTNSRSGLVPQSLINLKKSGVLKEVAPNVNAAWDDSFNKTMQRMIELGVDASNLYNINNLPPELKELKHFDTPDLIVNHSKIDLQKQPVISFHHFYYDKFYIIDTAPVRNYLIDIFADGRVNFSLGPRLGRTQNPETLLKISLDAVQKLITKIKSYGFEDEALINNTKFSSYVCSTADCSDMYPERISTQHSYYYVTLRTNKNPRTLMFHNVEGDDFQPFLAKTFKLLEEQFPTQQYRCGTLKDREYYKYCKAQDLKNYTIANSGEIR